MPGKRQITIISVVLSFIIIGSLLFSTDVDQSEKQSDPNIPASKTKHSKNIYKNLSKLGAKERLRQRDINWTIRFVTGIPKKEKRHNGFALCWIDKKSDS